MGVQQSESIRRLNLKVQNGTNPLRTRKDIQDAVTELLLAVEHCFSPGRARVRLGLNTAYYSQVNAEMEGFARLLWGLVPLLAGGGKFEKTYLFLQGIITGTDRNHPEYWGTPADYDSRLVEATAIANALLFVPEDFWNPLSSRERNNLSSWLGDVAKQRYWDNNWLFFRVMVNLALRSIGARHDPSCLEEDLNRLESFYVGEGWYTDGPTGPCDYYNSFGMHFYGLVYARLANQHDQIRARRFEIRSEEFLRQFSHWFAPTGAALPYGRSLVYRFGQAAAWSALTLSSSPPTNHSWGVVKGVVLRHLRWWLRQPIYSNEGILEPGYKYCYPSVTEEYVSAGSPYWAMKSFVALSVPDQHPFWSSEEEDLPELPAVSLQRHPRMILCRDGAHVFALAGGQMVRSPRNAAEKYSKFCYSTEFGFSLPSSTTHLEFVCPDNALVLSEDGKWWRGRTDPEFISLNERYILSRWRPWPSITITTWLIPLIPWHVRVHRIKTDRTLHSLEGGFSADRDAGESECQARGDTACVRCGPSVSVIRDLLTGRHPHIIPSAPNTNILFARSYIPILHQTHPPGDHWLVSSVAGWSVKADTLDEPIIGPSCRQLPDGSVEILDLNCVEGIICSDPNPCS
jgi:hypothetical protein